MKSTNVRKEKVIFGFADPEEDWHGGKKLRVKHYRPTYAACRLINFDRYILLFEPRYEKFVNYLVRDVEKERLTCVQKCMLDITNHHDLLEISDWVNDFLRKYEFRSNDEYFINLSTGSHAKQLSLFLAAERDYIPDATILSLIPPKKKGDIIGSYELTNFAASRNRRAVNADRRMAEEESGVGSKNRNYQKLLAEIRYAARESRHPILIEGPTGSGKTFIAREIVFKEKRDSLNITGGFYEINAATLEGGLVQSALFGHEKGQASNVTRDRKGCLELAHKGVLFLDEIGELPLQTQAILLKAIDEKSFLSATGKQIKSDFQLIAGTNKDLSEAVHAGTFRKDLFARINTFRFTLPGLAERSDDIASIFEEELKKLTLANGEPVLVRITPEARKRYLDFAVSAEAVWADNYRDLIGSLERMRVHAQNSILTLHIVNEEIERLRIRWKGQTPKEHFTQHNELLDPAQCDPFDSVQLGFVIETCKRYKSIAEAGRYLFNHSRKQRKTSNDTDRLRKYLSSHGLSWERIKQMAD